MEDTLERCARFRLNNGIDRVNGGVYTSLDSKGNIFSDNKDVCLQAHCAWSFAYMCASFGIHRDWLDASDSCLDFIEKHCIDHENGDCLYFTVSATGKPVDTRRCLLAESFYAIANVEYAALTGHKERMSLAREQYGAIWKDNRGLIAKTARKPGNPAPCDGEELALMTPMRLMRLSQIFRRCDEGNAALYDADMRCCADAMICLFDDMCRDGGRPDEYGANTGRIAECSWLIMKYARSIGDAALARRGRDMLDCVMRDERLRSPADEGVPDSVPQWQQGEELIAALMAYRDTGDSKYRAMFESTFDSLGSVFDDDASGAPEVRDAPQDACHLSRMLIMVNKILGDIVCAQG